MLSIESSREEESLVKKVFWIGFEILSYKGPLREPKSIDIARTENVVMVPSNNCTCMCIYTSRTSEQAFLYKMVFTCGWEKYGDDRIVAH